MPNATNQNQQPKKSSGGFGAGFLVATIIFLVIVVIAGLAFERRH